MNKRKTRLSSINKINSIYTSGIEAEMSSQRSKLSFLLVTVGFVATTLFFILLLTFNAYTSNTNKSTNINETQNSMYYFDFDGNLSIDTVSNAAFSKYFTSTNNQFVPRNKTDAKTVWIKVKLNKTSYYQGSPASRIIFINSIDYNNFELYEPLYSKDENTVYKKLDSKNNMSQTGGKFIYPWVQLTDAFDDTKFVYIKAEIKLSKLSVFSSTSNDFFYNQSQLAAIYAFSIGIVLGILVFNIFIGLFFKSKPFLVHFIFLYSVINLIATLTGSLGSIYMVFDIRGVAWIPISIISFVVFFKIFAETKKQSPYLNYYLNFFIGLTTCIIPVLILIKPVYSQTLAFALLAFTGVSGGIIALYIHIFKKSLTYYFLFGTVSLAIGTSLLGFSHFINVDSQLITIIFCILIAIESLTYTIGFLKILRKIDLDNHKLYMHATTDKLTKLYNRTYLDGVIANSMGSNNFSEEYYSVIVCDIDHFKKINDLYGHKVGDMVLQEIAEILSNSIRQSDILIRWGGEEFLILLPDSDLTDAIFTAHNLKVTIENHNFKNVNHLTMSFGMAQRSQNESFDALFKRADFSLYRAKKRGRNRIISSFDSIPQMSSIHLENFAKLGLKKSGNDELDRQHGEIIKLFIDLAKVNTDKVHHEDAIKIFEKISEIVALHNEFEEAYLEEIDYHDRYHHASLHREQDILMSKLIIEFKNDESSLNTTIVDLSIIVIGHLSTEDFPYFPNSPNHSNQQEKSS